MKEKIIDLKSRIVQKESSDIIKNANDSFFQIQKLFGGDVFCSIYKKNEEFLITKKEFDNNVNADYPGKIGFIIGQNSIYKRLYTPDTSQTPTQNLNFSNLIDQLKFFDDDGIYNVEGESVLIEKVNNFSDWNPFVYCDFDARLVEACAEINK